ncbi:hypothetical protein HPB49_004312 [Dermacentor silvarum]|uniref:Uncharacterized protein n=1 Tax=Dermacentor silvarum TaxID=543639 RepID=A0ACB8DU39_DERSI|nr:hypothetical protein HPB49_004312 [Dermacentor silvarum]
MHEGELPTVYWPLDESPWKEVSVSLQRMANLEEPFTKERPPSAASSGVEPVCPVCDREFKMHCHMVRHLRSVHSVNPATFPDMPQSQNQQWGGVISGAISTHSNNRSVKNCQHRKGSLA